MLTSVLKTDTNVTAANSVATQLEHTNASSPVLKDTAEHLRELVSVS